MHRKTMLKAGVALLLPVAISACGSRITDNTSVTPPPTATPTPTPTPAPTGNIQTRIGGNFLAFFNALTTAEPRDPAQSDLPPLSFTTEPIDN